MTLRADRTIQPDHSACRAPVVSGGVPQPGRHPRVTKQSQRAKLGRVDHDGASVPRRSVMPFRSVARALLGAEERDDAVAAGICRPHHALVAVDQQAATVKATTVKVHARIIRDGCDSERGVRTRHAEK
jgi:hypothetical protein